MTHGTGPASANATAKNARLDCAPLLPCRDASLIDLLARALAVFVAVLASLLAVRAQTTASVEKGGLPNPTIVNLYWDQTWDADNPGMTRDRIDNFTSALVNSSYMSGLAEYGFTSASA
jgi:hypothetical protein